MKRLPVGALLASCHPGPTVAVIDVALLVRRCTQGTGGRRRGFARLNRAGPGIAAGDTSRAIRQRGPQNRRSE
ncbi:hypothetical protein [Flexivirga lutea]